MNKCKACFWQCDISGECFHKGKCIGGDKHENKQYPTIRLALNDTVKNAGGMMAKWEQDYKQRITLKRTVNSIEHTQEVTVHLFEKDNCKAYRVYDDEGYLYWIDDKIFSNEHRAPVPY